MSDYCRNCGSQLSVGGVVCSSCHVPIHVGIKCCQHCGLETDPEQTVCKKCKHPLQESWFESQEVFKKSRNIATALAIFLGWLGMHNFYLGHRKTGTTQLIISVLSMVSVVGMFTLFFVPVIWSLKEAMDLTSGKINTDAYGMELKGTPLLKPIRRF